MLRLEQKRGTIRICGSLINDIAKTWIDNIGESTIFRRALANRKLRDCCNNFHVTVATPSEYDSLGPYLLRSISDGDIYDVDICDIGVTHITNKGNDVWIVAIYSQWADNFRHQLELSPSPFHITLGFTFTDVHDVNKGFETISIWNHVDNLLRKGGLIDQICSCVSYQDANKTSFLMDYLANQSLIAKNDSDLQIELLKKISKWAIRMKNKELAKRIGYHMLLLGHLLGLRILIAVENRNILKSYLVDTCPIALNSKHESTMDKIRLFTLIANCNIKYFENERNSQMLEKRHSDVLTLHGTFLNYKKLPRNFSWVSWNTYDYSTEQFSFKLAGSAFPTKIEELSALRSVGIRHIITLHETELSQALQVHADQIGLKMHFFVVIDRTPPVNTQLREICRIIHEALTKENVGILIHCQGGVGRTNTVLIAYLIRYHGFSATDGIKAVTETRKIILSDSQQVALRQWWTDCSKFLLSKLYNVEQLNDDRNVVENIGNLTIYSQCNSPQLQREFLTKAKAMGLPKVLMLCGCAASGKSTFSQALVSAHPYYFSRISRDEMKGKGQYEFSFHDALRRLKNSPGCLILDCCHLTKARRQVWLKAVNGVSAWCVYFDLPLGECEYRVQHRQDHPTIPPGEGGLTIIRSMRKQLEAPELREGFIRLVQIRSDDDVGKLMTSWGIPFKLPQPLSVHQLRSKEHRQSTIDSTHEADCVLKFPRTAHLFDLGAATRDDKIASVADSNLFARPQSTNRVHIEEKMDGSNIGIFISSDGRITAQNRSHFITSSYHAQFAPLDKWISKHADQLWQILEPGRHILYGEWLYATHSVYYSQLPDWFIAYDLYDRHEKKFLSRSKLASLLANTSICQVPLLFEGTAIDVSSLRALVDGPSAFVDGRREGVVVRLCNEYWVIARGKLVRPDFIAGNERWNRTAKLELNQLSRNVFG